MTAAATASIAVCAAWTFVAGAFVVARKATPSTPGRVYSDEDGEALAEIQRNVSQARLVRIWIPALSSCILLLSALNFATQNPNLQLGMITSGWAIVELDTILLARESTQRGRFAIGLWLASSSTALSIALLLNASAASPNQVPLWAQFCLGIALALLSCSLTRRPDVFYEKRVVDRQMTCSAVQRFTFAWIRPLLDQARKQRTIEYDDLPSLGQATRSEDLKARFPVNQIRRQPLWRVIISHHRLIFYQQWLTATIESVASIMPPICMYMILSLMEARTPEQTRYDPTIWFWIMCLALTKTIHVGLASWLQWVSFAIFAIPVRSQLSALIFAKSLRMTHSHEGNVAAEKGVPRERLVDEDENAYEQDAFLREEVADFEEGQSSAEQTTEAAAAGIVNLLGVDVARVSEFCGWNQDLLRGLIKVVIAASLLVALLGWKSTLAGFAVPIILWPVNNLATKYYTSKELEVMAARDNKTYVFTEALHGIRQIKFSATEVQWEQRILAARERELKAQWDVYVWGIFLTFAWIAMPVLIGAVALSVYAWTNQQMIASVAFTALSVFSGLEWTISAVPTTITEMLDARVSANRIEEHLNAEERHETTQPGDEIVFRSASIAWPSGPGKPQVPLLHDLNLRFPPDELSVISGKTGAGKSLLLASIIGEAEVIEGEVRVPRAPPMHMRGSEIAKSSDWIIPSAIAFVGQVPWIENASVKETILYGLPYRHDRYSQVLHACALVEDIEMLPDGEDTEVGAAGINLSGGQRWRLTFARALYSRAGILILDDIFSAVDSHVGKHLLTHAILGTLGTDRTKILVTHHTGLVQPYASFLVTLTESGTARVLNQVAQHPVPAIIAKNTVDLDMTPDSILDSVVSKPRKFVEDETRSQGRVKWNIYKTYLKASGGFSWGILALSLFSLAALSTVARSYWLTLWTQAYSSSEDSTDHSSSQNRKLIFYLSIYLLISMVSISLVAIKITLVLVGSLRAARHLFEVAASNVLRARMRWLDTQPVGRILNRFVGDFALVDSKLGGDMTWCANGIFSTLTIISAALFISVWMIVPVVLLVVIGIYIVYLYLDAARDIKRLESTSKSPIHELVSSALSGLPVIRSFNRVDTYLLRMYKTIDCYSQTSWYVLLASQWMRFRQGLLGTAFTLCIAMGVAYFPNIDASLAGFALSFALDFSDVAEKTIDRYTATELDMNSMERVSEYMDLGIESLSGAQAPLSWPSNGCLVVRDLQVGYAEHLESVLKGISFSVQPRERIGIVGRTGSGKSSLMLSLFRFLEARTGSIEVDGLDLSTLRLHDIRSRLTIIPQDPVLFSGTLRSNLDLFDEHKDNVLLEALERVTPAITKSSSSGASHDAYRASDLFRNLSFLISRGGSNLSQGEKQLICLARAILARPKILVLDEATSAVDMETDALIQRSIRHEFQHSTLIVVAHRLSTVADFDKILVMGDGSIAEYDTPKALAQRKGLFWQMCDQSGEKEALRELLR